MVRAEDLKKYVESAMPGASVRVTDMTGTGDHFEIEVVSPEFEGLGLLERHRKLHAVLSGPMEGAIHAVKFKALTPEQKAGRR